MPAMSELCVRAATIVRINLTHANLLSVTANQRPVWILHLSRPTLILSHRAIAQNTLASACGVKPRGAAAASHFSTAQYAQPPAWELIECVCLCPPRPTAPTRHPSAVCVPPSIPPTQPAEARTQSTAPAPRDHACLSGLSRPAHPGFAPACRFVNQFPVRTP